MLLYEELTRRIIAAEMKVHRMLGPLRQKYKPDFMVDHKVIVEIKAAAHLTEIDEAQVINYLRTTGYKVALLINFAGKSLEWKRFVV